MITTTLTTMKRTLVLLVAMLVALVVFSGVALALTITCTTNLCEGTSGADTPYERVDDLSSGIEAEAWAKLSALLKNPERLRIGVDRMMEEDESVLRGDPTHASKHWCGELEKTERTRSGYLDQQAGASFRWPAPRVSSRP